MHELVAQITVLSGGLGFGTAGYWAPLADRDNFTRSFPRLVRSRVVTGRDAAASILVLHLYMLLLFCIPQIVVSIAGGLAEYVSMIMLLRLIAFGIVNCAFLLVLSMVIMCTGGKVLVLTTGYNGLGVTFGGLLYRIDKISRGWKYAAEASNGSGPIPDT